jgi:hypothetical protein
LLVPQLQWHNKTKLVNNRSQHFLSMLNPTAAGVAEMGATEPVDENA